MKHSALLSLAAALAPSVSATVYSTVAQAFTPSTFFDQFDFFTDTDPTNGFVVYQSQADAQSQGLISSGGDNDPVTIKVGTAGVASSGRNSVRIQSKTEFNQGLFIFDASHMPVGCGTWPAFWTYGPDATWPDNGEIDIIEHVNQEQYDNTALHTSDGCSIDGGGTGTLISTTCDSPGADDSNQGCAIHLTNTQTFGVGFNDNNGGVYAMEWTSDSISIWMFPRGSIPDSVYSSSPDTSTFGEARAVFSGSCDISSKFQKQKIIINTTFCGDWAGAIWSSGSCASLADTCNDYVENNPSAFTDAYWTINNLTVFSA